MVLGFIFIGWVGGAVATALYLGLSGGTALGAVALFSCAGAATILLAAALTGQTAPRSLTQPSAPPDLRGSPVSFRSLSDR